MRAVVQHEFGPPEVLKVEEVDAPEPIPTEIQVRVHAAGVNPVDFKTRVGEGVAAVLGDPPLRLGWDVSGVVSEVGFGVTRFSVGDEVFGMPWFPRQAGAYAEFVTAPAREFAAKPERLSHTEAGALPLAGLTAWQLVVDTIRLEPGQRILIHGAAGGVGHLAVQVAKARGGVVIGTARADQASFLHGLGVDEVIDYRRTAFDEVVSDLDAVIDFPGAYGQRSLSVLRPGGILVSVPSGAHQDVLDLAAQTGRRAASFLVEPDQVGLAGLADLIATGKLEVEVARVFDLADVVAAHRLAESGPGRGKVVLQVNS
ncbi:NADP-dependent oxidoreductase [Saccharopolyspora sp. K220]|uniref:NADP-dependent oxidoreductase n=1 Tax=Saccharopolyspora soli TaxID=2926618 RepID=UPI001F5A9E5F|nr:NADP-dependent oxidoreductase [Saccharopolyspora soli]MCI2418378.1 NADP-dependent oxidoreductase [Saccharopolyspora soli]